MTGPGPRHDGSGPGCILGDKTRDRYNDDAVRRCRRCAWFGAGVRPRSPIQVHHLPGNPGQHSSKSSTWDFGLDGPTKRQLAGLLPT